MKVLEKIIKATRYVSIFISYSYSIFAFCRDEFLEPSLVEKYRLGSLMGIQIMKIEWWYLFVFATTLLSPEILSFFKNLISQNKKGDENKVTLIPRFGKIHQELWENESVWLEIVGTSKTNNMIAVLKKVNSNVNGRKSEHIEELTDSLSPQLKVVEDKIFVVWNNIGEDSTLALNTGKSKPLPKEIDTLEVEIDLFEEKIRIAKFDGCLIRDWSKWKLENNINKISKGKTQ